ncbi:flagellar assembly factor FliW [Scopulibacillus darangshiensis]|uniref:Flagellar assembly factor FliW n=1 Tax=Scopulibacillus darangshiensis TaxID=442528 RepID=A0A4R2NWQ4_9BACL|nr:flagellar assembly protein FliW [Scopulibacillus darangshiensis]TCP26031.1 flagellar assembly factor FliW [Scopulibacillus darangshiensis]
MNIETKYFGGQEIEEKEIFEFTGGVPGFLDEKEFILQPLADDSPFQVLQSVNNTDIAFVIAPLFFFTKEFDFSIPEAVVEQLGIEAEEDIVVYAIVTIKDPFSQSTVNLRAPILLNVKTYRGKQLVLDQGNYDIRYPIFLEQPAGRER